MSRILAISMLDARKYAVSLLPFSDLQDISDSIEIRKYVLLH